MEWNWNDHLSQCRITTQSILFLRSSEQWVGGLGVVIMVICILIRPGTAAARLYKFEAREEKIKPSITGPVKTIWWIYLSYTLLGIVLNVLAGIPLFDSICNTFTTICTGGMPIKNDSIGFYHNNYIYIKYSNDTWWNKFFSSLQSN